MNYFKSLFFLTLACISLNCLAQEDDLRNLLGTSDNTEYVTATFKTTRLINSHTIETVGKRTMDFRISHRFGEINSGTYNFWGIDGGAAIRLGIEYSYDGNLMVGFGRSSYEKMLDGFAKYRLVKQTNKSSSPVSITLFSSASYTTMKDPNKGTNNPEKYHFPVDRFSYTHEIIIGKKFNDRFSFQLSPTLIHYNIVEKITDKNSIYAMGTAFRFKFTQRFAVTGEYVFRLNKYTTSFSTFHNAAGIGIDVETGGHVFQVHITNAAGISENQFIPYTQSSWKNLGIRIGFNISRAFTM